VRKQPDVDDFRPALGLEGAHAQTLLGWALKRSRPDYRRIRRETGDGGFVDVDCLDGSPGAPGVLLLHGLEGSSSSGYLALTAQHAHARGWHVAALNFRGCSGEASPTLKTYCSGNFDDALATVRWLRQTLPPGTRLGAVGFSLGGNQLLRMLGGLGKDAGLDAAVAVSAPFDLAACAQLVDHGPGWMNAYRMNFVRTMKAKSLEAARRFPEGRLDEAAIARARGIRDLDEAVTAKVFGYPSAQAYYDDASSGRWAAKVEIPTLLLSADDDPIAPAQELPGPARKNPHLTIQFTPRGGHVGFIEGSLVAPRFWCEARAVEFLATHLVTS